MKRKEEVSSRRLQQLLSFDDDGGLLPRNYLGELEKFEKLIVWKKAEGADVEIPEPQRGLDQNFDQANDGVNQVKQQLEDYIGTIRTQLKCKRISYSHAKFRYELEIPTEVVKGNRKPREFEFTSQRKGFERFHTQEIKDLVDRLETAEEQLKDAMIPFLCAIFTRFHE